MLTFQTPKQIHYFYNDLFTKYTSAAVKRRMITIDINAQQERIKEIEQAIARTGNDRGWYLGDHYTTYHLNCMKNELSIMKDIRTNI